MKVKQSQNKPQKFRRDTVPQHTKPQTRSRRKVPYYLGNALMLIALCVLFYIYYPLVKVYLFPRKLDDLSHAKGYYIQIPKISAQSPIIESVDPWNEKIYREALIHGVGQAKGTGINQTETLYLFAHSSDVPWRITQYNTAFFRLFEIKRGDSIKIFRNGKEYIYYVTKTRVVSPSETKYLINSMNKKSATKKLILQTCTPIGTDFQRLLVFAEM